MTKCDDVTCNLCTRSASFMPTAGFPPLGPASFQLRCGYPYNGDRDGRAVYDVRELENILRNSVRYGLKSTTPT